MKFYGILLLVLEHFSELGDSSALVENQWNNQWRGKTYFSHHTTQSAGVCILVENNLEYQEINSYIGPCGRIIIVHCIIQGDLFILVNTYAPNLEMEQEIFFKNVFEQINKFDISTKTKIIWGGDFNFHFSKLDGDGGNVHFLKHKSINIVNNIMKQYYTL